MTLDKTLEKAGTLCWQWSTPDHTPKYFWYTTKCCDPLKVIPESDCWTSAGNGAPFCPALSSVGGGHVFSTLVVKYQLVYLSIRRFVQRCHLSKGNSYDSAQQIFIQRCHMSEGSSYIQRFVQRTKRSRKQAPCAGNGEP